VHQPRPFRRVDFGQHALAGSVADRSDHGPATEAIRAFNVAVLADRRVDRVLLPTGDGMTLARTR
jgi:caffeoyl-CoA O-methyltransferase